MAFDDPISMQESGVVLIGAVALDNVYEVQIEDDFQEEVEERAVFGEVRKVYGATSYGLRVTLRLYQDNTTTDNLHAFRVNHSTGIGATITIRPLGTGNGLPELILNPPSGYVGMDLKSKPQGFTAGKNKPYGTGDMIWAGDFPEEPAWSAQSA